jgi:tRNA dimethylallyltransferase
MVVRYRPLVAVCGPTGSGKSALAIKLARQFGGEIVNCDSMQVYRGFDIGTAKLPIPERGGIQHCLIDVAEPAKGFTAGDFARLGRAAVREISERGNLPILCGGTGFYLRALVDGLSPAPPRDESLRAALTAAERRRSGVLHRWLRRFDPVSAARIHPNDAPKLIRAIEIRTLSSRNASSQQPPEKLEGYEVLKIGLFPPRGALYAALDQRCEQMFDGGLLPEIRSLLDAGVPQSAKPFESLGYKEGLAFLSGALSREAALEQMKRDTRRYAKRQVTWFRHEPGIARIEGFGTDCDAEEAAMRLVARLLDPDC